ncbi:putative quorum-sensing-regulated virulence factor [Novipirellula artificiosorum]|uniref:putative quorum-sensing-regulated virulence factor n=1 Tax=Novipirellula artificiosorum TaxID=2528016 RepID=UPI0036F389CA
MPLGKYQGTPIQQLPPSYADWVLHHSGRCLNPWLRKALVLRLKTAEAEWHHPWS